MIQFAEPTGLGEEIARLSAHIEAATGRLLELIRAFDATGEWHEQGFPTCARWLSWRTGIGAGAARERVRVARALGPLPKLTAALGAGELSYSVARALTRVATPDNEAELVRVARHTPASDMERLVGAWRLADRSEAEERDDERARHARRGLWITPGDDGSWRVRGRLDPEVGALLCKALEAAAEALYADSPEETPEARRADAIGRVAEAALSSDAEDFDGPSERFQVVVHVSAETLEPPRIEHGPHVSAETSRRLACDASVVTMTHDREGNVLDVGRRRRRVPPRLRRALDHRDETCRFPGCGSRFCDAHHVHAWADGGETNLANLVLLCRRHHRRVHEDGWRVEVSGGGDARFYRPDGRLLPRLPAPPPVPEEPSWELGVAIDAWTATPDWEGDRIDIDWALFTLRGD